MVVMRLGCQTSCLQRVSDHSPSIGACRPGCRIRQETRGRIIAARGEAMPSSTTARFFKDRNLLLLRLLTRKAREELSPQWPMAFSSVDGQKWMARSRATMMTLVVLECRHTEGMAQVQTL